MRVCYVAHKSVSLAGGELSLLGLMVNIREYGVEPILLCDAECPLVEKAKDLGIPTKVITVKHYTYQKRRVTAKVYIQYPLKRLYNMTLHKEMKRFLKEERIDLLHLNSSVVCHEWANVAHKCKIPYVWHLREFMDIDHDAVTIGRRYFDSLVKGANKRIAISGAVKKYWTEKLGCECDLVYNGLSKEDYYQEHEILNNENVRCVIIARVVPGKGQLEAVKAVKILKDRGITNVRLTIVGFRAIDTSPYEKEIQDFIRGNNLDEYIELKDFTSDVRTLHAVNDVGLICSKAEAFGRITIEYMMAGLLAIGADSGGTPELIDDNATGLMYRQGNPEDLADKIEWVIKNRTQAAHIALEGQVNALENFTIGQTAFNVYKVYKQI